MVFFCLPIVITLICFSNGQECSVKITSCNEIKTAEGFKFSHGISGGNSVIASRHQTVIARGTLKPQSFHFTQEVKSMDNTSIVTATCGDLRIEVTLLNGQYISDSCVDFRVIDKVKPYDPEGEVTTHSSDIKCSTKNISCSQIETAGGFNFSHGISGGSTVTALHNDTVIAHGRLSPPSFNYTPDVTSMDNTSIVMATCEELRIQVTHRNGVYIRESCMQFRIIDEVKLSDPQGKVTPYLGCILIFPLVSGVLGICLYYIPWKRKQRKKNRATTFPAYLRWLMSCFLIKKNGQEERPDGIDPEAGGGTALMPSLNHSFSNGGIQPSTNEFISHSVVASGSNDQTVNPNVKDDPVGVNGNEEKCKPATQVSDMTGGDAVAWWTPNGSDPALTSRCSTAPDMDVDSSNIRQETEC